MRGEDGRGWIFQYQSNTQINLDFRCDLHSAGWD
jgi:hypothetical protein